MRDKELKKKLKNAYSLQVTKSEKNFLRRYEKRTLRLMDVLQLEFRYMGLQSIPAGVLFCLVCALVVKMENMDMIWTFSSMIPFCAVIPMILLSKSERNGMDEVEASCRFSLNFIRLVRMCIIGAFTLGLFLSAGIILKILCDFSIIDYIAGIITPYLVSDLGAMYVTRRWHKKDNIYGIFAMCVASSLVPLAVKLFRQTGVLSDSAIVVISAALLIAVIRESIKYVKESENISWNLC